jgi:SET domain-containing protein
MKKALIEVRNSRVHGSGVFALRHIPKGTRIVEYLGDRISHRVADERYQDHDENDNHTFLFIVDRKIVIDAAVNGNEARFINHSCDGNCESAIAKRRVFIDAVRDIAPGEELGYDYEIGRDKDDPPNVDEIYACRCGAAKCRGSMLWPPKKTAVKRKKRTARKRAKPASPKTAKRVVRRQPARKRKTSRR